MRHRKRLKNQPNVTSSGAPNPIRWTHSEREGITAGHMGYGSPTWASATDKPFGKARPAELGCRNDKLPEVKTPIHIPRKVTSLAGLRAFHAGKRELGALRMDCVPCGTDFDEKGHAEKAVSDTMRIGDFFARVYSGKVMLRSETKDFGSVPESGGHGGTSTPKLVWSKADE